MLNNIRKVLNSLKGGIYQKKGESYENINLKDYEKSPIRFEYEAILEEYRVIWSEIRTRSAYTKQITNFAIIVAGGLIGFIEITKGSNTLSKTLESMNYIFPFVSMIFAGFVFMQVHNNIMIAHLGSYSDSILRPKMKSLIEFTNEKKVEIWSWNQYKAQKRSKGLFAPVRFILGISNYFITVGANIGFLVMSFINLYDNEKIAVENKTILIIATIVTILVIIAMIQQGIVFKELSND